MHEMQRFHFWERYGLRDLYKGYDQAGADVIAFVRAYPGSLIVMDLSGIRFLGYSYSKATFVPAIRMATSDPEGGARVVAYADDGLDLGELVDALEKFKQALILLESPAGSPGDGRILGAMPEHLRETWAVLAGHNGATTAEVASLLSETLQNTNQRLKRLDEAGLIRRERVTSPSGGWEWKNKMP